MHIELRKAGDVVIVDLSGKLSAGLGELVAGLKTARNLGATLKILNQSARVQQSLYITRLLPVFDIHEDEKAALESLS